MNEPSDADLEKRRAALVEQWKREVKPRAAVIDPRNEHDGWALTLGQAIAKGEEPEAARDFATYLRYEILRI